MVPKPRIFETAPGARPQPGVSDIVGRFRAGRLVGRTPVTLDKWRVTTDGRAVAAAVAAAPGGGLRIPRGRRPGFHRCSRRSHGAARLIHCWRLTTCGLGCARMASRSRKQPVRLSRCCGSWRRPRGWRVVLRFYGSCTRFGVVAPGAGPQSIHRTMRSRWNGNVRPIGPYVLRLRPHIGYC